MTESFLIKNSIQCLLCGDILVSTHRHDFVQCTCEACFVDGGVDYQRTGGNLTDIKDLSVYSDASFEVIRENLYRESAIELYKRVLLRDMDNEWLNNVIEYEETHRPNNPYLQFYRAEKEKREI